MIFEPPSRDARRRRSYRASRAVACATSRVARRRARRRASSRVVASTPRGALASHVVARMFPRLVASAFATGVACAGVVVGYGAALGGRACDCERVDARARDAAYDREAKTFDDAVRSSEYWSGIENMRASLAYGARGDVLEVACGTGRNFSYYDPKKVRTLLAMDACDGMVEEARAKLRTRDGGTTVREAMVTRGDAQRMRNLVKTGSVDTVVDTFGLCSYEDAVGALREMKRVVKRDGGRVLLLEHGRSEYGWLSNILDHFADAHARRWGCYWNRDILKLIEDAGLEIVEKSTHHLGTTFVIEATPRKG